MNKTAIKNFAIWARNKLIADIVFQAGLLGITEKGITSALPQSTQEVQFFDIGTKDYITVRGNAIRQRDAFVAAIKAKQADTDYVSAFRFVVEKVAYTWFNRLIAIRFMEVNDYLPSRVRVLSSENPGKAEPDMVTRPFDTDMSFSTQEKDEIMRMKDENNLDELFRMLFIKQCQKLSEVLPGLFDPQGIERVDSYLGLLLTISFTDKDGVLWHLINDIEERYFRVRTPEDDERQRENNIPEDNMPAGQIEIIGWMYQYYNTEPKQLVFDNLKKNIKINKDNIPAATQLFTPDWIVRYMVENSLGRLWVEGHPNEELRKSWKYYLEEVEQEPKVQAQILEIRKQYATLHPEEIKVIDPCMGSGHILVYLFDVLMQIYESQGWTQREAAQSIVQNNLYGLDIDDRASQLAYFAVMMKARQYDRRFLERGINPHVIAIKESNALGGSYKLAMGDFLLSKEHQESLNYLIDAFVDAKEYGSILQLDSRNYESLQEAWRYTASQTTGNFNLTMWYAAVAPEMPHYIEQAIILNQKYHVVVTNPPYMGGGGMGEKLSKYVKDYYPDSKSDLFAVCLERGFQMLEPFGFESMITMESWMFLTSFERLRAQINNTKTIVSLIHMPYLGKGGTSLGINFGTEMSVVRNLKIQDYIGTYDRIAYYETDENGVPFTFPTINEYYHHTKQKNFSIIPGSPIAYWVSSQVFEIYAKANPVETIATPKQGFATTDNDTFLRLWFEVDINKFSTMIRDYAEVREGIKWVPYNKGGAFRQWYGNLDYICDWESAGRKLKSHPKAVLRNPSFQFRKAITWSLTNSGYFGARLREAGSLFDTNGMSLFADDNLFNYLLAFLCSKLATEFMRITNPTLASQVGDIARLPVILPDQTALSEINNLVSETILQSKRDWDSFETSWNFKRHPFITNCSLISQAYDHWNAECTERFDIVKNNEQRINELFIKIYHLENELTSDVDDRGVTIHKADLSSSIRSFISYVVGCMLGRYSPSADGLAYAGGNWESNKYSVYTPDPDNCIPITDEPYFEDDIVGRFVEFIRTFYGTETLEENLTFIANALGNKGNSSRDIIRNYFLNDFIKNHIRIYQKRPIYWLFDSGKQNGFKALVYMHRWNADTVGNLRVEYLHRMQRVYEKEIERMQDIIENSRDNREINQANKRREKLVKQLKEARDYDAKIAHVALSRVDIDLDDGVKVNYEKVQKGPDGKSLEILAKI